MSGPLAITLFAAGSLIVGATPFGYFAGKAKGVDIRQHGSGNIGATNVIRVLGKKIGIPIFLLDVLKGLIPVMVTRHFFPDSENPNNVWVAILAGICTVLGHNYTFWLNFKGGKGIATSAGVFLGLMWLPMVCGLSAWIITFLITRYVAIGSIVAAITIPVVQLIQHGAGPLFFFAAFLGVLAICRHRGNIRRLIDGTEHRFQRKREAKPA